MRIAIISDIPGNLTALDAVAADLNRAKPDLVLHGGDWAASGSQPVEVIDLISQLGWPGVIGNTDEMLWTPEALPELIASAPKLCPGGPRQRACLAPKHPYKCEHNFRSDSSASRRPI